MFGYACALRSKTKAQSAENRPELEKSGQCDLKEGVF